MNGNKSGFKPLKNGLPQGSVLSSLLFNAYVSDIPSTTWQKFTYADGIGIAVQKHNLGSTEQVFNSDLLNLHDYISKWGLHLNPNKTEVASFRLNNKLANHHLNIHLQKNLLNHNANPKYLGVTLERTSTF